MFKIAYLGALSVLVCGVAFAAGDPAAGKTKSDATCAKCHAKEDWADENAAALQSKIHDVVAGKTKHKVQLKLTDAEMANIAAYWAGK